MYLRKLRLERAASLDCTAVWRPDNALSMLENVKGVPKPQYTRLMSTDNQARITTAAC